MMTPFMKSETLAKLQSHGMVALELIDNVQDLIDEERDSNPVRKQPFKMTWDDYYTHDEILQFMEDTAATFDYAETEIIGKSYEGRDMKVLKICRGGCGNKPAVWLDG